MERKSWCLRHKSFNRVYKAYILKYSMCSKNAFGSFFREKLKIEIPSLPLFFQKYTHTKMPTVCQIIFHTEGGIQP